MTDQPVIDRAPIQKIMELTNTHTEEDAVTAVWQLVENLSQMDALLNTLSVVSVVTANGRPLFVQLPPTEAPDSYLPQALEHARDALVEASMFLRVPLLQSRARRAEEGNAQ